MGQTARAEELDAFLVSATRVPGLYCGHHTPVFVTAFSMSKKCGGAVLCAHSRLGLGSCLYRVVQLISGRQCTLRHLAGASGLRGMGQATLLVPRVALASFDYTQGLAWHGPEVGAQGLTPQNTM